MTRRRHVANRSFDHLVGALSACAQLAKSASNVASHTLHKLSTSHFLASRADLLSNYLSQRLIDPVLPARSGFLKVIKNVAVNSQRDKLLGIRDGRRLRREFRRLRGCRLERGFSRIPWRSGKLGGYTKACDAETATTVRRTVSGRRIAARSSPPTFRVSV